MPPRCMYINPARATRLVVCRPRASISDFLLPVTCSSFQAVVRVYPPQVPISPRCVVVFCLQLCTRPQLIYRKNGEARL